MSRKYFNLEVKVITFATYEPLFDLCLRLIKTVNFSIPNMIVRSNTCILLSFLVILLYHNHHSFSPTLMLSSLKTLLGGHSDGQKWYQTKNNYKRARKIRKSYVEDAFRTRARDQWGKQTPSVYGQYLLMFEFH